MLSTAVEVSNCRVQGALEANIGGICLFIVSLSVIAFVFRTTDSSIPRSGVFVEITSPPDFQSHIGFHFSKVKRMTAPIEGYTLTFTIGIVIREAWILCKEHEK